MKERRTRCHYCRRVLSLAAAERGEWTCERGTPDSEIAVHVDDCERMTLREIRIAAQLRREAAQA